MWKKLAHHDSWRHVFSYNQNASINSNIDSSISVFESYDFCVKTNWVMNRSGRKASTFIYFCIRKTHWSLPEHPSPTVPRYEDNISTDQPFPAFTQVHVVMLQSLFQLKNENKNDSTAQLLTDSLIYLFVVHFSCKCQKNSVQKSINIEGLVGIEADQQKKWFFPEKTDSFSSVGTKTS